MGPLPNNRIVKPIYKYMLKWRGPVLYKTRGTNGTLQIFPINIVYWELARSYVTYLWAILKQRLRIHVSPFMLLRFFIVSHSQNCVAWFALTSLQLVWGRNEKYSLQWFEILSVFCVFEYKFHLTLIIFISFSWNFVVVLNTVLLHMLKSVAPCEHGFQE